MAVQYITYQNDDGSTAVMVPDLSSGLTVAQVAAKDVPNGRAYQIVTAAGLPTPTSSYTLAKTTPWRRMTSAEAEAIDAVLAQTDAQLRNIFMAATYISTGDGLFTTLRDALVDAFGATRADEILAPE